MLKKKKEKLYIVFFVVVVVFRIEDADGVVEKKKVFEYRQQILNRTEICFAIDKNAAEKKKRYWKKT